MLAEEANWKRERRKENHFVDLRSTDWYSSGLKSLELNQTDTANKAIELDSIKVPKAIWANEKIKICNFYFLNEISE